MAGAHTCCPLGRQIGSPQEAREANLLPFSSKRDSQAVPGGQGTTKAQEGFGREGSQSHRARLCTAPAPRPASQLANTVRGLQDAVRQQSGWKEGHSLLSPSPWPSHAHKGRGSGRGTKRCRPRAPHNRPFVRGGFLQLGRFRGCPRGPRTGAMNTGDRTRGSGATAHTAASTPRSGGRHHPPCLPCSHGGETTGGPPQPRVLQETPPATQGPPPHAARRAHWLQAGDGRQACVVARPRPCILSRRASGRGSQQHAGPQPCCKVLTHTEHSLSPRTLLAPSSSCADILIVLLWELAGGLSSGMARRGARAGCWRWLLPREAAHSDRLSNNLNLLRRACGTAAGPLYLLH